MSDVIKQAASPDAPTTTNEHGGSQSDIGVRFDLIDARAMFEMAKVLDHGAKKYGENNWRLIPVQEHLNHLLMHTYAYLSGDTSDEHLSHILCRATFAQGVELQETMQTGWQDVDTTGYPVDKKVDITTCNCNSTLGHADWCPASPNFGKEIAY